MKHNKNADTLLFLLSFTKCQREKNIERTFFVSPGAKKGWETAGLVTTLHVNKFILYNIYQIQKTNFQ